MKLTKPDDLTEILKEIEPADLTYSMEAQIRWDSIAKPLEGLGELERIITKIAGIQRTASIHLENKMICVMCSDNGVVAEGVTQTDSSVTAIVSANMAKGLASINKMASVAGAKVTPVDIGIAQDVIVDPSGNMPGIRQCKVAYGTRNFAKEPAMSCEEALKAIGVGIELVKEAKSAGYGIIGTGEMGIGNTTTSSAIASVLLGLLPKQVTGKGAGLSEEGICHKVGVIQKAIELHAPDPTDPLDVLIKLGGFDIAGLVGIYLGGALCHIPIVIDGVISSVSALLAVRMCPRCLDYMIASHKSNEPCGALILKELGLEPVICAKLALGEGTGTALLFPMLDMALEIYKESGTFEENKIDAYVRF